MGLFSRMKKAVGPVEAQRLVEEGAFLLDVREQSEWREGRAPRATHIPLGSLSQRLGELPKSRTIVAVCRSGRRSSSAASQLRSSGYTVLNLSGGMQAWQAAGLPVVRGGGKPGRVA
jgi:rhodanese-related sulfurtransferase